MRKIRILWLVNDFYVNNFKPIYDRIIKNDKFEIKVVTTNYYLDDKIHIKSKDIFDRLADLKIEVIDSYNEESDKFIDISQFKPDYVFVNSPYEMYFPKEYNFEKIASFSRLCNISYGSRLVTQSGMYENFFEKNSFYKYAHKTFVENLEMMDDLTEDIQHFFEVIGNVKLEYYHKKIVEPKKNKNFTVVWKPRWTMIDSKFKEYVSSFNDFFKENSDIKLMICIHPLFFNRLEKNDDNGRYFNIFSELKSYKNVELIEDGDFLGKVLESDVFVGEHSSTLAEFAATGKPIIFLETDISLNDFGRKISNVSYFAKNEVDVFNFLIDLKNGIDPLRESREKAKDSYFPNYLNSSKILLEFLEKDFKSTYNLFEKYKKNVISIYSNQHKSLSYIASPRSHTSSDPLYTIIIAHYNQMHYVYEAIDSVLFQDYNNIELIIVDDFSPTFNKKEIDEYISKNKNSNLVSFNVYQNSKNLGTSKSLNGALEKASGEFIQLFAADDALYDEKVVSTFVREFEKNIDIDCITTQCLMYDQFMKEQYAEYVDVEEAYRRNNESAEKQFVDLAFSCCYGAGGTAYRSKIFTVLNGFSEDYKLVEDWSFWLKLTRNGHKMLFSNFKTLKHREGGVSHSLHSPDDVPPHVKQYYKDILKIFEKELLDNLKLFTIKEKRKLIIKYIEHVNYYSASISDVLSEKNKKILHLHATQPMFLLYRVARKMKNYIKWKIKTISNISRISILSYFIWFITSLIIIENTATIEKNILLISLTVSYILIKETTSISVSILRKILRRI